MTRDYAKKTRPAPAKRPVPPWVWMLTGLLIGLFVAFLVYVNQQRPLRTVSPQAAAPAPKPAPKPAAKAPAPEQDNAQKMRFDFYKILPEYEVVIPEEDLTRTEKPLPAVPGRYVVQAGSFKQAGDADTRRAQLALLGLVSRVQKVTVDGKETWHRVQVGPFEQMAELDKTRKLMQDNGIDFIILKDTSSE